MTDFDSYYMNFLRDDNLDEGFISRAVGAAALGLSLLLGAGTNTKADDFNSFKDKYNNIPVQSANDIYVGGSAVANNPEDAMKMAIQNAVKTLGKDFHGSYSVIDIKNYSNPENNVYKCFVKIMVGSDVAAENNLYKAYGNSQNWTKLSDANKKAIIDKAVNFAKSAKSDIVVGIGDGIDEEASVEGAKLDAESCSLKLGQVLFSHSAKLSDGSFCTISFFKNVR